MLSDGLIGQCKITHIVYSVKMHFQLSNNSVTNNLYFYLAGNKYLWPFYSDKIQITSTISYWFHNDLKDFHGNSQYLKNYN